MSDQEKIWIDGVLHIADAEVVEKVNALALKLDSLQKNYDLANAMTAWAREDYEKARKQLSAALQERDEARSRLVSVTPYLDALTKYSDAWFHLAVEYGMKATTAANHAKHVQDAINGIRKIVTQESAVEERGAEVVAGIRHEGEPVTLTIGADRPFREIATYHHDEPEAAVETTGPHPMDREESWSAPQDPGHKRSAKWK